MGSGTFLQIDEVEKCKKYYQDAIAQSKSLLFGGDGWPTS